MRNELTQNTASAEKTYLSQSIDLAAVNDTFVFRFVVPDGYTKLDEVIFDPDKNVLLTLQSQKARQNVLDSFSTRIGSALGIINPGLKGIPNDNLTVSGRIVAAAAFPANVTITLAFK